ncbi:MAG TPA: ATP-binding protein [Oligoflexus sp.]|uniref:sensor histidine kinase n=1 Tax=Oligoflexus sp. TaxID=1971216 RepID=UPI002D7F3E5F|nr:ATP-binding protein [Oligoflexus sp.]HET9241319.1 ATP-binding protein [Oligoflexus sp.]
MPLFTILMSLLLLQVLLTASLFWDHRGGRMLLLHLGAQTLCWTLLKHLEDPSSQLFSLGMEQTVFWANILLGLVWVDWSLASRPIKILFAGLILLGAAASFLELFEFDVALYVAGTQIALQLVIAFLLAQTIQKDQDVSLSAFLGGWLGLMAIHLWSLVSVLGFEQEPDMSSQFIGAFIAGTAACFRLAWLMISERNQEMERLKDELQARDEALEQKDKQVLEVSEQFLTLEKEFLKMEKDLKRSQAELYQQAKTTSLGQSSVQISYQLQSMLVGSMNRLRRIVQGLEDAGHRDSAVCQQLAVILKSMDQATILTSSLQKFGGGRKESADAMLNVQTWLQEVISLCDQRMKKSDIHLDIKDEAGDLWVKGRVADLMHALLILLNNSCEALEYSEVKRITIELKRVAHEGQEWLRFIISDSGQGVPTGIRARIFQPFFSTKNQGQGSGLGLTIASRIFADHGGGIQLDAEALATTFIVELPLQTSMPQLHEQLP